MYPYVYKRTHTCFVSGHTNSYTPFAAAKGSQGPAKTLPNDGVGAKNWDFDTKYLDFGDLSLTSRFPVCDRQRLLPDDYMGLHIDMYICIRMYMYVYMNINTYVYMYIYVYVCIYMYVYVYM